MKKSANLLSKIAIGYAVAVTGANADACEIYQTPEFAHAPSQQIIEPCSPYPINLEVKPDVSQRVIGRWGADTFYHPGDRSFDCFGREHIRTATILRQPAEDFLQLNSNGTFCEKQENKIYTGFFGVDYNPHQNTQGTITFYNNLNPLTISKQGKVEVSDQALRISFPNKWNHVFKK